MARKLKATAALREWTKQSKIRMVAAFGGRCAICQYSKCIKALEFHHLDPNEKDFHFNVRITNKTWPKICAELRKCVLLCANCHREVHHKVVKIPKDAPKFNEEYSDYHAKKDPSIMNRCPVCKELKMKYKITCSLSCAAKYKPSVNWENFNLEEFIQKGYTINEIADKIGVSAKTVSTKLSKMGLR
jgi:hypothetical protein